MVERKRINIESIISQAKQIASHPSLMQSIGEKVNQAREMISQTEAGDWSNIKIQGDQLEDLVSKAQDRAEKEQSSISR